MSFVLGIDIGTSGVKVLTLDREGMVAAKGSAPLPAPIITGDLREQDPQLWWLCTLNALRENFKSMQNKQISSSDIDAIAVDGTSGTVVPVDERLRPLRPGIMYNDQRAKEQAEHLNAIGDDTLNRLGYRFNATYGLPKILWLYENEPRIIEQAICLLHQADFITTHLAEIATTRTLIFSDESNALKTGYDILQRCWPDYLKQAGIDKSKLPQVTPIGTSIASIGPVASQTLGLKPSCRIVAGMTDGTAACSASGARNTGDMNTTLGSTIVWKLISSTLVSDPKGRLYSHRHPGEGFLPGGAGNSGGKGLSSFFKDGPESMEEHLTHLASGITPGPPTGTLTYPLSSPGERFPFVDRNFESFTTVLQKDESLLYRSCLEGIACIERWGYEVAHELGAETSGEVWTTGRGASVIPWLQIRADFLNRPVCCTSNPESAYGTALVAAMNVWFGGSWEETAAHLIKESHRCEPRKEYRSACGDQYLRFRDKCDSLRKPT